MSQDVYKVHAANFYLDGASFAAQAEEITLPEIPHQFKEHKAVSSLGAVEFWAGIGVMSGKLKLNGPNPDLMAYANNPMQSVDMQVWANVERHSPNGLEEEVPLHAQMQVKFKKAPGLGLKAQENAELETEFTVSYYKLTVDGRLILEVDPIANIFVVDGEDLMAARRANLGG